MKHRGFEPRTTWLKVKCSTDWANAPYLFDCLSQNAEQMPRAGIEPATQGFSVLCSTNWAIWAKRNCGGRIWTYDLRVMSPTSFQTAPPRDNYIILYAHFKETCNLFGRFFFLMDGGGFEPPKALLTDLQSVPFGHSGNHPEEELLFFSGAYRARTCDPLLVRQMLSQLS